MKTWWESDNLDTTVRLYCGDVREVLAALPDESVHTVVTSPPYWGLRSYGTDPQVWGGDPACGHEWSERVVAATSGKGGNWTQAENGEGLATGRRQTRFKGDLDAARESEIVEMRQGLCAKCGAWRGELGLEPEPAMYVAHIVEVFREVRRVLRQDGTLWLNLGDCYATGAGSVGEHPGGGEQGARWRGDVGRLRDEKRGYRGTSGADNPHHTDGKRQSIGPMTQPNRMSLPGLKPKDLGGVPWRVAFALQADGWWLRNAIVWFKSNPMPSSVTDRCTNAYEFVFLLAKAERYFFDQDAIREPHTALSQRRFTDGYEYSPGPHRNTGLHMDGTNQQTIPAVSWPKGWMVGKGAHGAVHPDGRTTQDEADAYHDDGRRKTAETPHLGGLQQPPEVGHGFEWHPLGRNKRDVWEIATQPYPEAHFATFPEKLVEPCVLAGTSEGGACSKCGTPWVHRVAAEGGTIGKAWHDHKEDLAVGQRVKDDRMQDGTYRRVDLGYGPGCTCGDPPAPCAVLDPFAGSGTALLVAQRLGRSAVGIEMNPKYCELARRRIEPRHSQTRLLFR